MDKRVQAARKEDLTRQLRDKLTAQSAERLGNLHREGKMRVDPAQAACHMPGPSDAVAHAEENDEVDRPGTAVTAQDHRLLGKGAKHYGHSV